MYHCLTQNIYRTQHAERVQKIRTNVRAKEFERKSDSLNISKEAKQHIKHRSNTYRQHYKQKHKMRHLYNR